MNRESSFGDKLRWWRTRRGLSQLDLAGRAGISQRHLSFLELGRASPSREMVTQLAVTLNVPLRQQNALLVAAGYAPAWRETNLGAPDAAPIRKALGYMLSQQEPFPAVVVDRHWNLLFSNSGAIRLVEFLVGPLDPGTRVNLADALVAPGILRPYLTNWREVVAYFIRSVALDAMADGTDESAALLERLTAYEGVPSGSEIAAAGPDDGPVLPMHFCKDAVSIRLFTMIATLGTPQDVTMQELRVESFFPMDDATMETFKAWASAARPPTETLP